MSLSAPLFLLLLALIPAGLAVAALARRRRRRFAVRFPAAEAVAVAAGSVSQWRRRVPAALLALSVAALALALARPQRTVAVAVERASVMLIMDSSRSMLAEDVSPTRIDAARAAAQRFLDRVPERLQVGLVGFSTAPHTVLDPTEEHDDVRLTLAALSADGGTATGDALAVALDRLAQVRGKDGRRAPAAIVLLSDGKTTDGADPVEVARLARRDGVPVYTVSLGTAAGVVELGPFQPRIAVPPDPETMRAIARESGGRAFEVEDAGELDRVYESLGSRVGSKDEQREITAAFAGAALVLLLGAAATGLRWRGRLP